MTLLIYFYRLLAHLSYHAEAFSLAIFINSVDDIITPTSAESNCMINFAMEDAYAIGRSAEYNQCSQSGINLAVTLSIKRHNIFVQLII